MPRVLIDEDPLIEDRSYRFAAAPWSAGWIGPARMPIDGGFWAFRRAFTLENAAALRIHVSADQRYLLYFDGHLQGRGPERSDLRHWMYDSYDIALSAGEHTAVAVVWYASPTGATPPPWSQMTQRPGFWLMGEGVGRVLNTDDTWQIKMMDGIAFDHANQTVDFPTCVGPHVRIDGRQYPWGVEQGGGDDWQPVNALQSAAVGALSRDALPYWLLRPAMLPPMRDRPIRAMTLRHIDAPPQQDTRLFAVRADQHIAAEGIEWNALLSGVALTIPPRTRRRVIVDLRTYLCGYTAVTASAGRDAIVRIRWAESLRIFDPARHVKPTDAREKANRNEIEGRIFYGYGDTFIADGHRDRRFTTPWWNAGRYLELFVETFDEPLTIESIALNETGYPYDFDATFEADDFRLAEVAARALHTLLMCSHETSVDCPYYEQLNYAGDTRLQSLVAMTHTRDDRLVRKSIKLFNWSRTGDGWSASRTPSLIDQTIPTFSLAWVGMVYDYALWRGDRAFVASVMPGVRSVLERWRLQIDRRGLVLQPAGWNFIDWVPGWTAGMSNPGYDAPCAIVQWQVVYTLMKLAALEDLMNEPLLAQRNRQTAAALAATAERLFFDPRRQLFSDDLNHHKFSEHAQVFALLSGQLSENLKAKVSSGLEGKHGLAITTVSFSHYTFEALGEIGRVDLLLGRLGFWFDHERLGLSTLLEKAEPARSDCHAWGAHPAYHFLATILGVRPAAFGFAKVRIRPQLGTLKWARGAVVHPQGTIDVSIEASGDGLHGRVALPTGVTGTLELPDRSMNLVGGENFCF